MSTLLFIGFLLVLFSRKHATAASRFLVGAVEFLTDLFPVFGRVHRLAIRVIDGVGAVVDNGFAYVTPCLAWLWVMSVALTLAEWCTPLEMASPYLRSAAHCSIWLLIFFAAKQFGWPRNWPVRLWQGTLLLAAGCFLLLFVYIGFPLLYMGAAFFLPVPGWKTTYVHFQRGETILVDQQHEFAVGGTRRVLLRPLTPWFQWVEKLPNQPSNVAPPQPAGEGWVVVNKKAADFSPDPLKQLGLNNAKEIERQCWADRRRIDSLAIGGQLPLEARTLPAATQHGANTVGCLAGGEVWRNYLIWPKPGECRQAGAVGIVQKPWPGHNSFSFTLSAIMRVGNIYRFITLRLPELRGPGVYTLSNDAHETNSPEAAHLMLTSQKTVEYTTTKVDYITTVRFPGTLTITRFDTVARVVSGTFQGNVYDVSNKVSPLPITQGRFDVQYYE